MEADCNPHSVLDFLKLYIGLNEPVVTTEQSGVAEHSYLRTRTSVKKDVPRFLSEWLDVIQRDYVSKGEYRNLPVFSKFRRSHTFREFLLYKRKWKAILRSPKIQEQAYRSSLNELEPRPEMYKGFQEGEYPYGLESDLFGFCLMQDAIDTLSDGYASYVKVSPDSYNWLSSLLSDEFYGLSEQVFEGQFQPKNPLSILTGNVVGAIQHIPKKGTVKRRPIAAPNRFIQMGLGPLWLWSGQLIRKFPQDVTYDQGRMDRFIQNRLDKGFYVGSVDLSQATDNLPRDWGYYIYESIGVPDGLCKRSYELFKQVCDSGWENEGFISQWTVGQPLGTLPSFNMLGITHNVILESLSFALGYSHSPYVILGDDLVVFSRKLRKRYIRELTNRNIPLSLHKSYENRLVEFAGKIFIRNQKARYVSDHLALTWESLFDYQRSSGIVIPFNNLPKALRKKFLKHVASFQNKIIQAKGKLLEQASSSAKLKCDPQEIYRFIQEMTIVNPVGKLGYSSKRLYWVSPFYYYLDTDKTMPDRDHNSGIVEFGGSVIYYLDPHSSKGVLRWVKKATWFEDKFRPNTTAHLIDSAILAAIDIKGSFWKE
jgi:hypothetical protein